MSRLRYEPCPNCVLNGRDRAGDNFVVYPDDSAHCFSCANHRFPSFSTRFNLNKRELNVPKALLPGDFTREVPGYALKWLLQWGIPYTYWKEYLGFSPKEDRLIFCVGSPTAFSIGRYVGTSKDQPRKWYVWGDPHKHCESIGEGETIVLVEDLISAHKVALSGVNAVPLFGTQVHKAVLYYLLNSNKPIVMWLDKDQQGPVKQKALHLGSLLGYPVKTLVTDNDPKTYSIEEIKCLISQCVTDDHQQKLSVL